MAETEHDAPAGPTPAAPTPTTRTVHSQPGPESDYAPQKSDSEPDVSSIHSDQDSPDYKVNPGKRHTKQSSSRAASSRRAVKTPAKTAPLDSDDAEASSVSPSPQRKRIRSESSVPKRKRSNLNATPQEMKDLTAGLSVEARRSKSHGLVWNNLDTFNKSRANQALDGLLLASTKSMATAETGTSHSLDTLLALDVVRNYEVRVNTYQNMVQRTSKAQWSLEAVDPSSTSIYVLFRMPTAEYTQEEATIIADELIKIYNRWPGPTSIIAVGAYRMIGNPTASIMLVRSLRTKYFPDKPILCPLPKFFKAKGAWSNSFKVSQRLLDPTTYSFYEDKRDSTARTVRPMGDLPDIPARYEFVEFTAKGAARFSISKTVPNPGEPPKFATMLPSDDELEISAEERIELEKAEHFARLWSVETALHGTILDKTTARRLWTAHVEKFGGYSNIRGDDDIFMGKTLLHVSNKPATVYIGLAAHAVSAIKKANPSQQDVSFPEIIVRSSNRAWSKPIEQLIRDSWLRDGDIKLAWTRAAAAADETNLEIRDGGMPPNLCVCTRDMVNTTTHICAGCARVLICSLLTMSKFDGQRVCRPCESRRGDWKGPNRIAQVLAQGVQNVVDAEFRKSSGLISKEEAKNTKAKLQEYIESQLPTPSELEDAGMPVGLTFRDQYTNNFHSVNIDSARSRRTDPQRPSLDAVFPCWLMDEGYRIHVVGNVRITTTALNQAKHIQIPAFLDTLSAYVCKRDEIKEIYNGNTWSREALQAFADLESDMVKICRRFRKIRLIFGWTVKGRLQASATDPVKFNHDLQTLISGRQRKGMPTGPWDESDNRYVLRFCSADYPTWPEVEVARIVYLVDQMFEFFGVELRRSNDGCPYFGHPDTMPDDWSWVNAFTLMAERLSRMVVHCNRYGTTYDTPVTIFLECIFQVCITKCILNPDDALFDIKKSLKEEYASILELPLGVAFHDPLTFVIGNAHHGEAMRSGWPVGATRLQERLDNNSENNMRIEARTENFLKFDFDESTYPLLKQIVRDVKLPKEIFDRDLEPESERFQEDYIDIPWDDDYGIAEQTDLVDQSELEANEETALRSPTPEVSSMPFFSANKFLL